MKDVAIITLLTISQTVMTWTNVAVTLLIILACLWLLNYARRVVRETALDVVTVWAGWQQAQVDRDRSKAQAEQAILLIQQKRMMLLEASNE